MKKGVLQDWKGIREGNSMNTFTMQLHVCIISPKLNLRNIAKETPLLHCTCLEGLCHCPLTHPLSSASTPGIQALFGSAFLCSVHSGNGGCQPLLFEYLLNCCF